MDFLRLLEGIRQPGLDGFFLGITGLGASGAALFSGLLLYWCVDKAFGFRLLFLTSLGASVNGFLKAIFRIPRPWVLDPGFSIVEAAREGAGGYSFPSGHTQNACILLGSLALWKKRKRLSLFMLLLILLTGFSRMYLGVHTPLDVSVSLFSGGLLLFLFFRLFALAEEKTEKWPFVYALGLFISFLYLCFVFLWPERPGGDPVLDLRGQENAIQLFACQVGIVVSHILDRRWIRFETKARWWAQLLKMCLGLLFTLGLWFLLKKPLYGIFATEALAEGILYFILCVAAGAVWPLSFRFFGRLGK